jgi:hypothetical protein
MMVPAPRGAVKREKGLEALTATELCKLHANPDIMIKKQLVCNNYVG